MQEKNKSINNKLINIDAHAGALILIDMLFKKKLINEKTYNSIQNKYNTYLKRVER